MKMSPYITMKKRMIKFLGGYTAQEYEELANLPVTHLVQTERYEPFDLCATQFYIARSDPDVEKMDRRIAKQRIVDDILKMAKDFIQIKYYNDGCRSILEGSLRVMKKVN